MPSEKRSDPNPTEDAGSAAATPTAPDPGDVGQALADIIEDATGAKPSGPIVVDPPHYTPPPATLQPERRTYKVLQAVMVDGVRVRRGELASLDPASGLAKSIFVVEVEPETAPPAVAAALAAAEEPPA